MFKDTSMLSRMAPKPASFGVVYFISTKQDASYPVKIGRSTNFLAANRMRQLQVGSPFRLEFFGAVIGGRNDELALHALFSPHHLRGEWFARSPELLTLIEQAREDNPDWMTLLRAPLPGDAALTHP